MPNAILDPLGRQTLTPKELVEQFSIVRANVLAAEFTKFPRHEDLSGAAGRVFFHENDLPKAVIFVSHRWLTPSHPDPDSKQLSALKEFLSAILQICYPRAGSRAAASSEGFLGSFTGAFGRLLSKPSQALESVIFTHGGYQAAYFLGDYNPFDPDSHRKGDLTDLGKSVLSKIGIWYDYSCMPQDPATRDQLVSALGRIHELMGASNFVALRQPGDQYDSRAWCAAEVSTDPDIERTRFRKVCLRLDKIGTAFPTSLLLEQPAHFAGIGYVLLKQLQQAKSGAQAASAIANFIRMVGVDAEDDREFPQFFVKRKPWLFEGQRDFMVRVMDALDKVSKRDEREVTPSTPSIGFDVAGAVADAARSVGLRSSNEADIAYTALLILYARHRGAPKLAALFADSLQRYLRGQTTVLARYREDREPYNEKCWYRFEDQIGSQPVAAWSEG